MVKGKNLNFIISNLRRSKWQVAAISFLLIIAAVLINIFLFLATDFRQDFHREKDRLNSEDIGAVYLNNMPGTDFSGRIAESMDGTGLVEQYEIDSVITAPGSVEYKDGILAGNITFMSFDAACEKQIGKYEILESDGSGIFLSYIFKVDGGCEPGQDISVKSGPEEYSFRIAGFYNNLNTGNANCADIVVLLPEDDFNDIAEKRGLSYRISMLLEEPEKAEVQESEIIGRISGENKALTFMGTSVFLKLSDTRYISATIFEAILSVAAILMIAVILATIAITLSNYIRSNIRNLGALKALGYKSADLIFPIVGEFAVIALVMAALGTAASYVVLPVLKTALEQQSGIPYQIHFLPGQAVLALIICILTAACAAFFSVLKIKKIYPINAIRDSASGKSTKRNYFALDRSRMGLNTALSFKSLIAGRRHGVLLFLSMTVIAFLLGFSAFTYQNVILDQDAVIDLVCGQRADSVLSVLEAYEDRLISELDNNSAVERYYMFSSSAVTPEDMPKLTAYVVNADFEANEQLCIQGNLPESANEIAVNCSYAKKNGLGMGDKLSFGAEDGTVEFSICGLIQGALHSGRDGFLTYDGYSRIKALPYIGYHVNLKEGTDVEDFNREMSKKCTLVSSMDYKAYIESVSGTYISILIMATIVVVVLSYVIAAIILYILLSIQLANKRREYGILKSLGFVTRDLIYQTVFCNMPPCVLGAAAGLLISRTGAGELLTSALNGIGIYSFGTPTKAIYLAVSGLAIILFIVVFSILMSGSVRKITPHEMFNKE